MEITRYVLVGLDDQEEDHEYDTLDDAKRSATIGRAMGQYAIVARTYVYDDHDLVWTPDGSGTWPPSEAKADEEQAWRVADLNERRADEEGSGG